MNKFLLLPFLALFTQAKSIELIVATQELNFDRVSQILDSRNYTSQERQQALNYINKVIAENKISKPWHKRYSALGKASIGLAAIASGAFFAHCAKRTLDDIQPTSTEAETSFKYNIAWGFEWIVLLGPIMAYKGIKELTQKYAENYRTALAIKAILS